MSNEPTTPEFWERTNALINLANDQCKAAHPNEVSASTLYAAARFGAFIVAKTTGSAADMTRERERTLDYFTEQFRQMMIANLSDFIDNYDQYMGKRKG